MPAARRYYTREDIQTILNCKKTKALDIMHMFDQRGQLFRDGALMRVRVEVFEAYLKEREGKSA